MPYGFYPDIVAALRAQVGAEDHRGAGGLCRDAADEIERLREIVGDLVLRRDLGGTNPEIESAWEKARAAL